MQNTYCITREQYLDGRDAKTYGTANPSLMNKPFWLVMIEHGDNAWSARRAFNDGATFKEGVAHIPVWCFDRFGQTSTQLPDGRIVLIGGEHEDWYDPDFAIYNDVVVQSHSHWQELSGPSFFPLGEEEEAEDRTVPKPTYTIYGYPVETFPPTDFHTATYYADSYGEYIFIIGGLGYRDQASRTATEVYKLHLSDFHIEKMETSGPKTPTTGLCRHTAKLVEKNGEAAIKVSTEVEEWAEGNTGLSEEDEGGDDGGGLLEADDEAEIETHSQLEGDGRVSLEVSHLVIGNMCWL